MDLTAGVAQFHIPAEVVDLIISGLQGDIPSLKSARLVCRVFYRSATAVISNPWISPSELFTLPEGRNEYSDGSWPTKERSSRASSPLFTTWTWLEIPASISIETKDTAHGQTFNELIRAPDGNYGARDGRQDCAFGRVQENANLLWIVHQWPSVKAWDDYRSSTYARDLRDFFEDLAPGSVKTSKSEYLYLPYSNRRARHTFPEGFCLVGTIYFPASMRAEDRQLLDEALPNYPHAQYSEQGILGIHRCSSSPCGSIPITWLPGYRVCEGTLCIARRFLIHWYRPETEQKYMCTSDHLTPYHKGLRVLVCQRELEAFGALRVEYLHCTFHAGPSCRG